MNIIQFCSQFFFSFEPFSSIAFDFVVSFFFFFGFFALFLGLLHLFNVEKKKNKKTKRNKINQQEIYKQNLPIDCIILLFKENNRRRRPWLKRIEYKLCVQIQQQHRKIHKPNGKLAAIARPRVRNRLIFIFTVHLASGGKKYYHRPMKTLRNPTVLRYRNK